MSLDKNGRVRICLTNLGKIELYFATQTRAKVSQLKIMLQNIKKNSLNINEYLSKVRMWLIHYLDWLHYSRSDHVEVIFNGLPEEYGSFIISVNSRPETYTVEEINPLFLAKEAKRKRSTRRNST